MYINIDVNEILIKSILVLFFIHSCSSENCYSRKNKTEIPICASLLMGQYRCDEPAIDPATQQVVACDESRIVKVKCMPAPGILCIPDKAITSSEDLSNLCEYNGEITGFYKNVECKWTNGYRFEISLLLSIFLGMFGIDRFYLGYPAIGLLKFSTLGFFFLGQLIDVLLIATQTVKPSDGSDYIIDYFGAGLKKIIMDNETIIKVNENLW